MDEGRPRTGALGPCHECGHPLPAGTQRYCVNCGAEVVDSDEPSWFRTSVTLPAPLTPSPSAERPAGARRPTSWSFGDFRAPSPTDGRGLPLPPEPDPGVEWNGPVDVAADGETVEVEVAEGGTADGRAPDAGAPDGRSTDGETADEPPVPRASSEDGPAADRAAPFTWPADAAGVEQMLPFAPVRPVGAGPIRLEIAYPPDAVDETDGYGHRIPAVPPAPVVPPIPPAPVVPRSAPPAGAPAPPGMPPGVPSARPQAAPAAPPGGPPVAPAPFEPWAHRPPAPPSRGAAPEDGPGGLFAPSAGFAAGGGFAHGDPEPDSAFWNPAFAGPEPVQQPPRQPGGGRGVVLPMVVAAGLVLVAVTGGSLWWFRSHQQGDRSAAVVTAPVGPATVAATSAPTDPAESPADPASTASIGADGPPSGTASAEGSPSPTDSAQSAAVFADAMDTLLDESASARTDVSSTVAALQVCRTRATTAATTLRAAGRARTTLATRGGALDDTGVPGGPEAVEAFVAMQRASAAADDAFAAWADDVARAGCRSTAPHTAHWSQGNDHSTEATAAKSRFVALWNPFATAHGKRTRSTDGI